MADFPLMRHIGDYICPKQFSILRTQAANAPALLSGTVFDRFNFNGPGMMPNTVDIDIWWTCAAATINQVLSIAFTLKHSPDGVTFANFATQAATAQNTAGAAGAIGDIARMILINADEPSTAFSGFNVPPFIAAPSINIKSANRYLQLAWTPSYAVSAADSFNYAVTAVFAGFDTLQAPLN